MTRHYELKALIQSGNFIDGKWLEAADHARFGVTNPATGESIAQVADSGAADARAATDAAARAFPAWRDRAAQGTRAILHSWDALIVANQESLGALISLEQGKPLAEAQGEVAYGASYVSMVRRRSHAHLRRHHSAAAARQAHDGGEGADWRGRRHHAVEFPARDDRAQDRAGARGRLHRRRKARRRHAADGARRWCCSRTKPACRRAC